MRCWAKAELNSIKILMLIKSLKLNWKFRQNVVVESWIDSVSHVFMCWNLWERNQKFIDAQREIATTRASAFSNENPWKLSVVNQSFVNTPFHTDAVNVMDQYGCFLTRVCIHQSLRTNKQAFSLKTLGALSQFRLFLLWKSQIRNVITFVTSALSSNFALTTRIAQVVLMRESWVVKTLKSAILYFVNDYWMNNFI